MRLRNIRGSREVIASSDYVVHEEETKAGSWHQIFHNTHPIHIGQRKIYHGACQSTP